MGNALSKKDVRSLNEMIATVEDDSVAKWLVQSHLIQNHLENRYGEVDATQNDTSPPSRTSQTLTRSDSHGSSWAADAPDEDLPEVPSLTVVGQPITFYNEEAPYTGSELVTAPPTVDSGSEKSYADTNL